MTTATQRYFHVIQDPRSRPAPSTPAPAWQSTERPWQQVPSAPVAPSYGYRVPGARDDYAHEAPARRRRVSLRGVLSLVAGALAIASAVVAMPVGLLGGLLGAPSLLLWAVVIVGVAVSIWLATGALVAARRAGSTSWTAAVGLVLVGLAVVVSVVDLVVQLLVTMR